MHPLRETSSTVTVTAEQAIEALYRRYHLFPPVDQRWVVQLIEGASEGRMEHPAAQAVRLLMDLGHTRDALVGALVAMTVRGVLKPPVARAPKDDPINAPAPPPVPEPLRNPYLDHVVESRWEYPDGWKEASVGARIRNLSKLFEMGEPERWIAVMDRVAPPEGFGTLVTVSPTWLARKWGVRDPLGRGYADLLRETIRVVRGVYRAANHGFAATALDLDAHRQVRMVGVAHQAIRELDRTAKTPFLVFPGQLGRRWRGSSIARVEWHASYADERLGDGWKEFPLPTLSVLCELVHEPFRLKNPGTLAIDCPGDALEGYWGLSMMNTGVSLAFGHDNLHLIDRSRTKPDPLFGSATGLVRA
jgi:hypothetical protein